MIFFSRGSASKPRHSPTGSSATRQICRWFATGLILKKTGVTEDRVHDSYPVVRDRIVERVIESGDPMTAVIHGVDDAWEICLLKFTTELIHSSRDTNIFDLQRRGLI